MITGKLVLLPKKDKPIRNFHHWIFSGAIDYIDDEVADGDFAAVYNAENELLGHAYVNRRTSIVARMVNFDDSDPWESIILNIRGAVALRKKFFDPKVTNAYRLINSEGDNLPGLIVDRYADVLVLQANTLGMDLLKEQITQLLVELFAPKTIYDKSTSASRKEEGLARAEGLLYGSATPNVVIKENKLKFKVDFEDSQKTGFFLDQREMRATVGRLSPGRTILNCFGYSGGFSVLAAAGAAKRVVTVDISEPAIALAEENFALNKLAGEKKDFVVADVFGYLRSTTENFDFIVLDPPAFAKRRTDVIGAARGYKDINRLAIQKIAPGGILLTSSCSYYVDAKLFQQIVFEAAAETGRRVRIIGRHIMASDHSLNIYHPEGEYLKSLLLYVE